MLVMQSQTKTSFMAVDFAGVRINAFFKWID